MSSSRKAEAFLHLGQSTHSRYQQLWMVYPEISAGYVGVSDSSLEFVHADKRKLTPPSTENHGEKYINAETHAVFTVEPGCALPR